MALRFLGRHRCPRCRMPLRAKEITCPICHLEIVFINDKGEVMVQMLVLEDLTDWQNEQVWEYHTMLTVENAGGMYLPKQTLPVAPRRADVVALEDGSMGIRYTNFVKLEDIRKE